MTISQLIIRLEAEKKIFGDITVCIPLMDLNVEISTIAFDPDQFMRVHDRQFTRSQTCGCLVLE